MDIFNKKDPTFDGLQVLITCGNLSYITIFLNFQIELWELT